MKSRLIIVANRLPVSLVEADEGLCLKASPGGMAAALDPIMQAGDVTWIGYTGIQKRISKKQLVELGMPRYLEPIMIHESLYHHYYNRVANGSLWPLFHGFVPRVIYSEKDWQASLEVNELFADRIMKLARPDDIIWIHDFHLIMLPHILRRRGVKNRIGYFLHIPFPQPTLLKLLPHHQDMLKSLTEASVCGLQTLADKKRLDKCLEGLSGVRRLPEASIEVFPVGIGYEKYQNAHKQPSISSDVRRLRKKLAGAKLIFSVSRLDYTKGILEQLEAFRKVLEKTKVAIIYKLVVSPSREALEEYRELKDQIDERVNEINELYQSRGYKPIDYQYHNMEFNELTSWYICADVMLVAPIIDGMNLVAKEYVATKPKDDGVLILSETAGAAQQMREALLVNPLNVDEVAAAILSALTMSPSERAMRHRQLRKKVSTEDALDWGEKFKEALLMSSTMPQDS